MTTPAPVHSESKCGSAWKGVVFQAPANGSSRPAQEARYVSTGLAARGIPIHLALSNPFNASDTNLFPAMREEIESLTHRKVNVGESILYYASPPDAWNLDYYGTSRIGRASFWSDRIPVAWVELCNALDEIWVLNRFNRESFAASGVDREKLRVVPTGVDATFFRPGAALFDISGRRKFNFLSITTPDDRKGTDILLTAYLREFHADDDVSLTLKIPASAQNPVHVAAELAFFIEKSLDMPLEKAAQVILMENDLPSIEMPSLYAAADAFVLPSRGALCGLTLLEALACEVPVIATRWGGGPECLNDQNSYPINVDGLSQVLAGDHFLPGHHWANPSVDHLRQLMREVVAKHDEARARAKLGRKTVVETHDWSVVLPHWEQQFLRLLS